MPPKNIAYIMETDIITLHLLNTYVLKDQDWEKND